MGMVRSVWTLLVGGCLYVSAFAHQASPLALVHLHHGQIVGLLLGKLQIYWVGVFLCFTHAGDGRMALGIAKQRQAVTFLIEGNLISYLFNRLWFFWVPSLTSFWWISLQLDKPKPYLSQWRCDCLSVTKGPRIVPPFRAWFLSSAAASFSSLAETPHHPALPMWFAMSLSLIRLRHGSAWIGRW